ncbi:hypothetical protein V3N99_17950 [Dermatophilaceae bacterium Soc4.6]
MRDRWDLAPAAARARGHAGNQRLHERWLRFNDRKKLTVIANVAVARELGLRNRGTVHRLVRTTLENETVDSVSNLRRLEGARLDALLRSVWDQAMEGDVDAVRAATGIVMARVRLFGLNAAEVRPTVTGRTVVLLPAERAALGPRGTSH